MDAQWIWDHDYKFARWQHRPIGHGARFAVHGTLVFLFMYETVAVATSFSCSACLVISSAADNSPTGRPMRITRG